MSSNDRPYEDTSTDDIFWCLRQYEDDGPDPDPGKYWDTLEGVLEELTIVRLERDLARQQHQRLIAANVAMEETNAEMFTALQACRGKRDRLTTLSYMDYLCTLEE